MALKIATSSIAKINPNLDFWFENKCTYVNRERISTLKGLREEVQELGRGRF
jgi:hypothetical protein